MAEYITQIGVQQPRNRENEMKVYFQSPHVLPSQHRWLERLPTLFSKASLHNSRSFRCHCSFQELVGFINLGICVLRSFFSSISTTSGFILTLLLSWFQPSASKNCFTFPEKAHVPHFLLLSCQRLLCSRTNENKRVPWN